MRTKINPYVGRLTSELGLQQLLKDALVALMVNPSESSAVSLGIVKSIISSVGGSIFSWWDWEGHFAVALGNGLVFLKNFHKFNIC